MFNPPARERNTTRKDRNEINLGGRVRGGRAKFATDEVSADFKIYKYFDLFSTNFNETA